MKMVKVMMLLVALSPAAVLMTGPVRAGCCVARKGSCAVTTEKKAEPNQAICPVMGGEINRNIFLDYEGKRVYFCCQACKGRFLEDPAGYLEKMKKKGVVLEDAPSA